MRDVPYTSARNSFHLMRFVLAALVIWCHCWTLQAAQTPLSRFTGGQMNEGTLAVDGFLVISGFLICQSSVRSRNAFAFLWRRARRIFPGLLRALAFSALVAGGLAYQGTYAQYLREPSNGPFTWIWNWLTLNVQGEQWGVAGVFEGNVTYSLNVSLWTIKHEVSLYLLMALLMLTTLNRHRPTYLVFYAFFLLLHVLLAGFGIRLWDAADTRFWVLSRWNYPRFVETGLYFFSGAMLYAYRDRLPRRWYLAVIALLAMVLGGCFRFLPAVYVLAVPYLVYYLACSPLCSGFARIGDPSYTMYLYSYPIQQLVYHVVPDAPAWGCFAVTLTAVLLPTVVGCTRRMRP